MQMIGDVMQFHYSALCGRGRIRSVNQDNVYCCGKFRADPGSSEIFSAEGVADGSGVFCVADGMGGGVFGEEASLEAVKLLREAGGPASKKDVDKYIRAANALVCSAAEEKGAGLMGTTLAYVGFDGRRALAANVGDSRIYRLRDGELEQLSRDHTVLSSLISMGILSGEDAAQHPDRHSLSQYIGIPEEEMLIEPDFASWRLQPGDVIMLCSDGLSGFVQDAEFARLLKERSVPGEACEALYRAAEEAGSDDNISVVVIRADKN